MTSASGLVMVERKLRQAAKRIKYSARRAITRFESLSRGSKDPLLPPAHLRVYYYGTRDPGVFTRACDKAKVEPVSRGLESEHRFGRLLVPGGWCVASCFLLNDDTREHVERGRSFMAFPILHESGVCRLHDRVIPEAAVAIEESFFVRSCQRADLTLGNLRRGVWSYDSAWDQDVVTLSRA